MIVREGSSSSSSPVWARGGQAPLRAQTSLCNGQVTLDDVPEDLSDRAQIPAADHLPPRPLAAPCRPGGQAVPLGGAPGPRPGPDLADALRACLRDAPNHHQPQRTLSGHNSSVFAIRSLPVSSLPPLAKNWPLLVGSDFDLPRQGPLHLRRSAHRNLEISQRLLKCDMA